MNEISTVVKNCVVASNMESSQIAKTHGYTVYGDIACVMEKNRDYFAEYSDAFAKYVAYKKNYRADEKFIQKQNFIEKYIMPDQNKLKAREDIGSARNTLIIEGIQLASQGLFNVIVKTLDVVDNKKMKETIWKIAQAFAFDICKGSEKLSSAVVSYLSYISGQLFGKSHSVKNISIDELMNGMIAIPESNAKNIAYVLYMIFVNKHLFAFNETEKLADYEILCNYWQLLGINMINARQLFKKFEEWDATVGNDFVNTNIYMQGIVNNLSIALPVVNMKAVREVNQNCFKYVPNGDIQRFVRNSSRLLVGTALNVGMAYLNINNNTHMIRGALNNSLDMFNNVDNEKAGNCLEMMGIPKELITDSLQQTNNKEKDPNKVVIETEKK